MKLTDTQVRRAALGRVDGKNMSSVLVALERHGEQFGLDRAHRLAHFMAQVMHESGEFRYDHELWGPTPAQKRYDSRTDLGNTAAIDGDGFLYRGRSGIQITGKDNYRQFHAWCVKEIGGAVPDFVKNPDAVLSDPWEGLVPIWYWTTRDLNRWADQGDIETIMHKINGGKNGFADRVKYYGRMSLVLLAMAPDAIAQFQAIKGLNADGDVGPKTRAALHKALVALTPGEAKRDAVTAAPVMDIRETVPKEVDKQVRQKSSWLASIFGGGGASAAVLTWLANADLQKVALVAGIGFAAAVVLLIGGEWIIRRIKTIRAAVEA